MEHLKLTEQEKKTILICAKHQYVIDRIEKVLVDLGFKTLTVTDEDDIQKAVKSFDFDALFFGGGIPPLTKETIFEYLKSNKPGVRVIDFMGGPANIRQEVLKVLSP